MPVIISTVHGGQILVSRLLEGIELHVLGCSQMPTNLHLGEDQFYAEGGVQGIGSSTHDGYTRLAPSGSVVASGAGSVASGDSITGVVVTGHHNTINGKPAEASESDRPRLFVPTTTAIVPEHGLDYAICRCTPQVHVPAIKADARDSLFVRFMKRLFS